MVERFLPTDYEQILYKMYIECAQVHEAEGHGSSVVNKLSGDSNKINPSVPVDLVIDHSVQVDVAKSENAVHANMELEFQRNKERFAFLKWGSNAFHNMLVVPPGSGIVHQINLEYLTRVVLNTDGLLYPDSVVGTDSHTTMIDGLVLLAGELVV